MQETIHQMPFIYQRPQGQILQQAGPITSVPKPSQQQAQQQQQQQAQNQVAMAPTQVLQQMVSELTVCIYHKVTFSDESVFGCVLLIDSECTV